MNDSGTNSVKPPVRSCSARTTRMCSASSQGSSTWPNITVTVERRPAACEASITSTQRATGSLLGEIRSRTPSWSTSAAVPGVEPESGFAQPLEHVARREPGDVAHVRHLHRRVGVQVDVGRGLLHHPQPVLVVLEPPVGVDARLHADLGGAVRPPPRARAAPAPRGRARRRRASACPGRSRRTRSRRADVRDVDVAVHHERHRLPGELAPQLVGRLAHVLHRLGPRLGEQRRELLLAQRGALAPLAIAPGTRSRRIGALLAAARAAPRDEAPVLQLDHVEHALLDPVGVHVLRVHAEPLGERIALRRQPLAHLVDRRERDARARCGRRWRTGRRGPSRPPPRAAATSPRGSAGSARPRRASAAATRARARACRRGSPAWPSAGSGSASPCVSLRCASSAIWAGSAP